MDFYRLFLDQIEKTRVAHRDARRFYTTLNITGATTIIGLQARPGPFDASVVVFLGCILLSLMGLVWYFASTHYDRVIQYKAGVVAGIERQLGVSYFEAENRALTGGPVPPRLIVERVVAMALCIAYSAIAVFLLVYDNFAGLKMVLPGIAP